MDVHNKIKLHFIINVVFSILIILVFLYTNIKYSFTEKFFQNNNYNQLNSENYLYSIYAPEYNNNFFLYGGDKYTISGNTEINNLHSKLNLNVNRYSKVIVSPLIKNQDEKKIKEILQCLNFENLIFQISRVSFDGDTYYAIDGYKLDRSNVIADAQLMKSSHKPMTRSDYCFLVLVE